MKTRPSKTTIKHIFVDAHVFDHEFQGTWTYLKEIYSILITSCPDVFFFFGAYYPKNLEKIFGVHPNVRFIKYRSKNRFIRLGIELPFILLWKKIDLAHFQYITPLIKVCKQINTIHDLLFNDFKEEFTKLYVIQKNFLYKRSARRSDFILTVSDYSKKRIEHYFPFTVGRIQITPNAVNIDSYYSIDKETSKDFIESRYKIHKYILYISRIEPRKNHDLLLRAFIDLKLYEQGYSLVFIGKQSIKNYKLDQLLSKIPKLGIYYYFDSIEQEELIHFYNAADLFVYPTVAEGFGIPPLEAGVMKTPVLCSSKTAMSDFDFFGDNLFNPSNHIELENKLLNNLGNPLSDEQLYNIKMTILNRYSWKKSANTIVQIINTIK